MVGQNIVNPFSILMLSIHGYVSADPELGKPDTGGQVVYVLELAKRFSRLGYHVDLVTRQFEEQPEFDDVNEGFRVWRIPFGGKEFIRKEDMHDHLGDFVTNALARIRVRGRQYNVVYSHYWDAGWAGQKIAEELAIPHVHTPHSLGWWKQHNMAQDMDEESMEHNYRFEERIRKEFLVYRNCDYIIATTAPQTELLQPLVGHPPHVANRLAAQLQPARLARVEQIAVERCGRQLGLPIERVDDHLDRALDRSVVAAAGDAEHKLLVGQLLAPRQIDLGDLEQLDVRVGQRLVGPPH